jgi:hypothetical protein
MPLPSPAPELGSEHSTVLRLLAAGLSLEAVAERLSHRSDRRVTTDQIRSVLRHTAGLMDDGASLSPPAEGAFLDHFQGVIAFARLAQGTERAAPAHSSSGVPDVGSYRPTTEDLHALSRLARRVIREHLGEGDEFTDLPDAGRSEQQSVALQYAEALLREAEVVARLNDLGDDAPLQTALPPADRNRIADFLLYRNLRGKFETLDSLVAAWQRFAGALEDHPETLVQDEYNDWLMKRDSLEEALSLLSPGPREDLQTRVRTLDERFVGATRGVSTSIRRASIWRPQRWWWFRVPRHMGDSFRIQLEHFAPAAAQEAFGSRKDPPSGPGRETAD